MEKEKIFALIRGIASDPNTVSDRTINEAIADWSDLSPTENAEVYWTKVANSFKKTIAGQVSAAAKAIDDKRTAEAAALKAEKEKLEKELAEARKVTPTVVPPVIPPVAPELPEEYKKRLDEMNKFMEDQKREKELKDKEQAITDRKKRILELIKDSKYGLLIESILSPIIRYMDFSIDKTDDEYMSKIQEDYNTDVKNYKGVLPQVSLPGGISGISSWRERKEKEEAEQAKIKEAKQAKINNFYGRVMR